MVVVVVAVVALVERETGLDSLSELNERFDLENFRFFKRFC